MKIQRLKRAEGVDALHKWLEDQDRILPALPKGYTEVRQAFQEMLEDLKSRNVYTGGQQPRRKYVYDVELGCLIFSWLNRQDWFSPALAGDDDFWRYLSVMVAPDLIYGRWENAEERYLSPTRNYLKNLWWYYYLSFRDTAEETKKMLLSTNFSTDTILNLVERTGRKGLYVPVTREIMYFYSFLKEDTLKELKAGKKDLFRRLMTLNTARIVVIEPLLFQNGAAGYARDLLTTCGVKQGEYPDIFREKSI